MGYDSDLDDLRAQIADVQEMVERLRERVGDDNLAFARPSAIDTTAFLKMLYQERRLRADLFDDPDLFGEPAWDILLDLAVHEGQGRPLSVTGACVGSAVAPTTALRWVNVLEKKGFIQRSPDPLDHRRVYLVLTQLGRAHMRNFVKKAAILRGVIGNG